MSPKLNHRAPYVIIMPAYNEAQSIGRALDALQIAIDHTPHPLIRVLICLNGCTDETKKIVAMKNTKTLRITTITSPLGYRTALNRLFQHAKRYYPNARIVKVDADCIMQPDALRLVLDQLDKHPTLQIVGGHPLPTLSKSLSPIQKLLARTFSLRSLYPLAQIANSDARKYHPFAKTDPQPGIGDTEQTLKPYFHGRIWAARSESVLSELSDTIIGDDIFLAASVYHAFGPGSIRLIYNANVLCAPTHSLRRHWMVYRRIHEDRRRVESIPHFTTIQQAQLTRLNWSYILKHVKKSDQMLFLLYWLITTTEDLSFRHTAYRESYWQYKEKESL